MPQSGSGNSYLEQVRKLSFEGREWTRDEILKTRDFLSPWSHNIRLKEDIFTAACDAYYPAHREIMQVVNDRLRGDFTGKRILDLGCLEGYFSVESALQGADVVGIEGKEINLKKCRFVQSVLELRNVRFTRGDAMRIAKNDHGDFDVVLALGLLYHLSDPYIFLQNVRELCRGVLVIETIIATEDHPQTFADGWKPVTSPIHEMEFHGLKYSGKRYEEFPEGTSQSIKDLSTTAALENNMAIWLTKDSLIKMLKEVGFSSVEEMAYSSSENLWWKSPGRVLFVAHPNRRPWKSKIFS